MFDIECKLYEKMHVNVEADRELSRIAKLVITVAFEIVRWVDCLGHVERSFCADPSTGRQFHVFQCGCGSTAQTSESIINIKHTELFFSFGDQQF